MLDHWRVKVQGLLADLQAVRPVTGLCTIASIDSRITTCMASFLQYSRLLDLHNETLTEASLATPLVSNTVYTCTCTFYVANTEPHLRLLH